MASAVAGDVVYFRGGTYNPGSASDPYIPALNPANSGSASNFITFAAYPGETPVIVANLTGPAFGVSSRNYIVWDGFKSTLARNTQVAKIVQFYAANHCVLRNCELVGIPSLDQYNKSLIQVDQSTYIEIYDNRLHGVTGSYSNAGAVWVMGYNNISIYQNEIYDCNNGLMTKVNASYLFWYRNYLHNLTGAAFYVMTETAGNSDFSIYQNVVVNAAQLLSAPDASAVNYRLLLYNNTVFHSGTLSRAIQIGNPSYHNTRNASIYNNIFASSSGTATFFMYNSGLDKPDYSDFNMFDGTGQWGWDYFTFYNSLASWRAASGFDVNSFVGDPLFMNRGGTRADDYRLQTNSPARTGGRGGAYSVVVGAYITGNEVIGYGLPPVSDTQPPTAAITVPAPAATVSGNAVVVSANATDNVGVVGVQFKLDGSTLGTEVASSPYTVTLDSTRLPNGINVLEATSRDAAGNSTTSAPIYVNVINAATATQIFFAEGFEDSNLSTRGWYDNTTLKFSSAEHFTGARSVEYHFLTGATSPEISGGSIRKKFTDSDSVYVSYYVKHSANWVGSNRAYHPHEFMLMTNLESNYWGPSVSHLTAYIEENAGKPVLAIQDASNIDQAHILTDLSAATELRGVAGCNGYTQSDGSDPEDCYLYGTAYRNGKTWRTASAYFQDTPGAYYKGNWHHVEVYFKLNSIVGGKGVADGVLRYWYDGNLLIDHSNVLYRTGQYPAMKFNQLLIAPYIGDGSPVDQTLWIDTLTVANGRPEPPAPPANLIRK